MDTTDIIGYIAGTLTTAAFIPQLIKSLKSKSVEGISFTMYFMFSLGVILWLCYGFFIGSFPVILANIITLLLNSLILAVQLRKR